MATVTKACEECTSNCHVMHKRDKNPSPSASATTFFKVLIGDFSKILHLPPKFTRSVRKKVGKTIKLENFNGEKFEVNITKVDGGLAFQKGWSEFVSAHELKVGDLLVFHYIMDKHFVVLMYGTSGCPELRHYQMETKKNNTSDHFSHESSSQPKKRMKEKETNAIMPNTRPGALGSDKDMGQRSDPLGNNTKSDKGFCLVDTDNENVNDNNIVSETPVTERRFILVENDNGNMEDERRKTNTKVNSVESGGGRKDYASGSSGGGSKNNEFRKKLEKRLLGKQKENTVRPSEATCSNSLKKRSRDVDVSATHSKTVKKDHDTSGSRLHNDVCVSPSTGIFHKPEATPAKIAKKEPVTSATKLHKPMDTPANTAKKEPVTMGSNLQNDSYLPTPIWNSRKQTGSNLEDTKMAKVNSHSKEFGNNFPEVKVKPEPVDDDETPLSGSINVSFSAVMSCYQYLELPLYVKLGSVKSNSTVIFLKNVDHLWAVLYQTKLGVKALTQSWGMFARETGIQLGDKCVFVPEKEPNVFSVHATRE